MTSTTGAGRAPGTDGVTAAALRRTDRPHEVADEFPRQLAELIRFLDDDFPDGHPYARDHAVPGPVQGGVPGGVQSANRPPVWLLGSSGFSARLAGSLGLPFAFAHHFSAAHTLPALEPYRASFRPSAVLDEPYALIGVSAPATDDEKEAHRQVMTGALSMLRLRTGRPGLVPTPRRPRSTSGAWANSNATSRAGGWPMSYTARPSGSATASTRRRSAPAPTNW